MMERRSKRRTPGAFKVIDLSLTGCKNFPQASEDDGRTISLLLSGNGIKSIPVNRLPAFTSLQVTFSPVYLETTQQPL